MIDACRFMAGVTQMTGRHRQDEPRDGAEVGFEVIDNLAIFGNVGLGLNVFPDDELDLLQDECDFLGAECDATVGDRGKVRRRLPADEDF